MTRLFIRFFSYSFVSFALTLLCFSIGMPQRIYEYRIGPQDYNRSNEKYGAIAYSGSSDRCGVSFNLRSRADAEKRAISECGESDCEVKVWFRNGCGALATGSDGSIGWAWSGNKAGAEKNALHECGKRSGGCRVRCWACSDR